MTLSIPAMVAAEETYSSRCREIERFFEMLKFMGSNRELRLNGCDSLNVTLLNTYPIGRDLEKTLKASAYLMLYNLVEASMTNAINAIHQHIANEKVGFDELKEDVRKIAIKGFRKTSSEIPPELLDTKIPISSALIWLGFDKKDLFSGNLDGRLIRDTAKEYGFQLADHDKSASRDGFGLLSVKTKRNELAHGGISFEDCGQDVSVDELLTIFSEIKIFIKAVLDGISEYLSGEGYLHADIKSPIV